MSAAFAQPIPELMKALVTTRHGGPDVLAVQTFPERRPGPGEVRVDVARAGLNFADLAARNGLYPDAPKPPMVVGYEGAGTVGEVGPDVKGVRPGDRVAVVSRFGGQASQVVVPEGQVFAMPAGMSFDVGAALPVQYLTAYHVLHHRAQLRPGGRVLIHGAGGGLGLATLQLCRQIPDVVLFGTASKAKHEALRAAGLQHPIDYRTEDYEERVKALTQGRGVDLVFDPRGGNDWRKGYRLLAPAGHLICMGWSNMQRSGRRNLFRVLWEFLQMPKASREKESFMVFKLLRGLSSRGWPPETGRFSATSVGAAHSTRGPGHQTLCSGPPRE